MADNRLYIQCKKCGEMLFLGSPSYRFDIGYTREYNVGAWMERHVDAHLIGCHEIKDAFAFVDEGSDWNLHEGEDRPEPGPDAKAPITHPLKRADTIATTLAPVTVIHGSKESPDAA